MNQKAFTAGLVGGAVVGAVGYRRTLGVIGIIITVIVTTISLISLPSNIPGTRTPSVIMLALGGALWLPWVAAKALVPWMKFRWHASVTKELVSNGHPYGLALLIAMPVAATVAAITVNTGPRGLFVAGFIAMVLAGLLWGFLTASIARDTAEALAE